MEPFWNSKLIGQKFHYQWLEKISTVIDNKKFIIYIGKYHPDSIYLEASKNNSFSVLMRYPNSTIENHPFVNSCLDTLFPNFPFAVFSDETGFRTYFFPTLIKAIEFSDALKTLFCSFNKKIYS